MRNIYSISDDGISVQKTMNPLTLDGKTKLLVSTTSEEVSQQQRPPFPLVLLSPAEIGEGPDYYMVYLDSHAGQSQSEILCWLLVLAHPFDSAQQYHELTTAETIEDLEKFCITYDGA